MTEVTVHASRTVTKRRRSFLHVLARKPGMSYDTPMVATATVVPVDGCAAPRIEINEDGSGVRYFNVGAVKHVELRERGQ